MRKRICPFVDMLIIADKGNKSKLQQLTDLVKRGLSAATSQANSRGPSRGVSRGATQDLDTFESIPQFKAPVMPADAMSSKKAGMQEAPSLDSSPGMSRKRLLQGHTSSSGPLTEGFQFNRNRDTKQKISPAKLSAKKWLSTALYKSFYWTRESSDKCADVEGRDQSSWTTSVIHDIFAAQPSQSASSIALAVMHDQPPLQTHADAQAPPHAAPKPDRSLAQRLPALTAESQGVNPTQTIGKYLGRSHTTHLTAPRAIAEGTEGRSMAKALGEAKSPRQKPSLGFMSGGSTGRSAPAVSHASAADLLSGNQGHSAEHDALQARQLLAGPKSSDTERYIVPRAFLFVHLSLCTCLCALCFVHGRSNLLFTY